ncbi:MAG: menaquinone biosynthesis protein [Candidatus Obscuribacterales bacterium]|nr:menaquinone biosynthesis protein [Candidatus Obscuribacterales bacterium]
MPVLRQPENRTIVTEIRPRLGQINFVNCLPVLLPLTSGEVQIDADITEDTPANLNSGYSSGELDLGAMSSFYYLSNEEDLVLLPGLSISTKAEVGSVLFFAKDQIENGCRIVVPASSATSVALLKLYLAIVHSVKADIFTSAKPDLQEEHYDAALVIGDRALTVDAEWTQSSERVDLGQWWSTNFKVPMVFGVWAARKNWREGNSETFEHLSRELQIARDMGLGQLFSKVLDQAEKRTALSRSRLQRYFLEELDYCLEEEHMAGLSLFKEQLMKHSIL